ncbi:MAG: hypothetical protein AAFU71_06575, partial [Cyanobacteria bacterium J06632_22]
MMSALPNHPLPDDLQNLAAGYVLGDLSSEEMADFQAHLANNTDLAKMVTDLQATLALMPYGLTQQQPQRHVKSQLLSTAKTTAAVPTSSRWRSRWHPYTTRTLAVALALMAGVSLLLAHRVTRLQTQLALKQTTPALSSDASNSTVTIAPADSILTQQWSGLAQLVQDHTRSLTRSQGPVDIPETQPGQLSKLLPADLLPMLTMAEA